METIEGAAMDNSVLRKRLNTFKSSNGKLSNVSDEVIIDVLRSWENWPGSSADLYRELGLSKMQLVILLKKGKKLVKSGVVTESEFREVRVDGGSFSSSSSCHGIELCWDSGKVIRFSEVSQLVDFLKAVA
jgi:hypothetical protein